MKLVPTVNQIVFILALITSANICFAQQPTDCINAITVCGSSEINLDVNGIGLQELNGLNNCSSQENNSIWLKVTLVTDGTLGFTLTPESTSIVEDYDFFVFGPNPICGSLVPAIRCSTTNPQAANQGNNLTGMNSTETDTSEGPGQFGNSFVRWLDVTAGETYFIVIDRPIGNSPFNLEWTGTAEFASPPVNDSGSSTAPNISKCDVDIPFDDNETTFDLSINSSIIIGSQTNVTVSYFESESDANIDSNPITGLYTNLSNPQEVYAKITDDITGCFEIIPFELIVNSGPSFTVPSDYELCDNFDDGNASNGQITFDLQTKNAEILNGQNAANFNITYHEGLFQAENNTDPLPNLFYNTVINLQTIFVRIEDASNANCFSTTTLILRVLEIPVAVDSLLLQCSETNFGVFNLNNSNDLVTGGIPNRSTKFYTSLDDAQNSTDEITDSNSFTNTTNPQTIYVQVINNTTICFNIAELTLNISNTSVLNAQITTCDDDGTEDGFYNFNLSDVENDILTGAPVGLTITYFELLVDALEEQNAINTNFTNTIPYTQTVFARVINDNGCYGIAEIDLTINMLPDIPAEDFTYYCLNTYPETITIDAGTDDTNYTYSWSTGEATSSIDINEIGIFTVTVTDRNTNCPKIRTITVEPSNIATIESFEIVDASDNNTITVIVSGEGDYEYALFNEFGSYTPYQSSNIFYNVLGGIYTVKIRDIKNGCGIVEDLIHVIGFPKVFTPNGDGTNDVWNIKGVSSVSQPNSKILIFDRYGKLLKEIVPLGEGWDGTFNGIEVPVSDYWFAITLQDGRIYKDHFTLKR